MGQTTDANGGAAAGAQVTARNVATNVEQSVNADGAGNYLFVTLPIGKYTITVEAKGFKKAVRENLVLEVAQKARVNFTLQIGGLEESFIVSDSAPF